MLCRIWLSSSSFDVVFDFGFDGSALFAPINQAVNQKNKRYVVGRRRERWIDGGVCRPSVLRFSLLLFLALSLRRWPAESLFAVAGAHMTAPTHVEEQTGFVGDLCITGVGLISIRNLLNLLIIPGATLAAT